MINKFKDFLKRLRKQNKNLSDQEENHSLLNNSSDAEPTQSWKSKFKLPFETKIGKFNLSDWKLLGGNKKKSDLTMVSLSPNLNKSIEKLLSKEARDTIHQVSLVLLICGITYSLGKITALVLRGSPNIESSRDYSIALNLEDDFNPASLNQVKSFNIFRTNTGLSSKKNLAEQKCDKPQQNSSLPITLINTVVLQDSVKSIASVQVRGDRSLQEVREGEQISNLAKIFKINRLEMVVKNLESGICESISSNKLQERTSSISVMSPTQSKVFLANKKMPGIENKGNSFSISKTLIDDKLKDIASILTQARAIKIQNPDGTLSFKMTELDPEGLFPYLGLQDQDIITSINGKPIYDMNEVMGLFAKIKNLDKLQLGIKREGTESMLDYSIKK